MNFINYFIDEYSESGERKNLFSIDYLPLRVGVTEFGRAPDSSNLPPIHKGREGLRHLTLRASPSPQGGDAG